MSFLSALKRRNIARVALGLEQDYLAALTKLREGWGDQWPTEVAQVYAWAGDADTAFEWLEKAYKLHGDRSWPDIRTDDLLAPLRDDPRWPGVVDKLGIPTDVLETLVFSVTVPE